MWILEEGLISLCKTLLDKYKGYPAYSNFKEKYEYITKCKSLFVPEGKEYLCLKGEISALLGLSRTMIGQAPTDIAREIPAEIHQNRIYQEQWETLFPQGEEAWNKFMQELPWYERFGMGYLKWTKTLLTIAVIGGVGYVSIKYVVPYIAKKKRKELK